MAHKSKTKNPSLPSKTISAPGWRESLSAHPWLTAVLVNGLLLLVVYYSALLAPRAIQQNEGVLQNPVLSHCKNIPLVFTQDFLLFTDGKYRPLSYALLTLPRMVFSTDAILFWHGWLMGFHLLNALLLFWLARQFSARLLPGLLVSVGFTVHPVSSVLVNNINQFYILFALSLVLLALNLYVRFSHTGQGWLYGGALVCSVLALFSAQLAFALPLILLVYELAYCRTPVVKAGRRLLPFVVFPLLYIPLFYGLTPHPLHYKYVKTHEDSFWHGFYSITGATGYYGEALLLGRHLPLILHETIQQIFTWSNPQYLVWIWILLSSLTASFWFAWKKRWLGLGLATCILGMVPYCSVEINQVVHYIDWAYLYLPLAGFLMFLAGGLDWLQEWKKPALTWGVYVVFGLLLLFWSGKTMQLNQYEKDAGTYWNHVFDLSGQKSPTALLAIGSNYLAQNQLPLAAHFFFTPMTKDIKAPCLAMAEYYSRRGEYLAAAIHLRYGSGLSSTGMVLEYECKAAANLLIAAQALDHAEENLGKILMVNPFSTWAMGRLAEVWIQKGFFQDARRMLEQMRVLAPSEPQVGRIEAVLQKAEAKLRAGENPAPIVPPSPDWLDYVLEQKFSSKLCRKIIELSQRADINDTVIQMEAMICHMLEGEYPQAAEKARVVYQCLSGYGYAASLVCEAVARSGDSRAAIPIGHRAVTLDTQSPMAWRALAIAYAGVSDLALDPAFEQTLERNPTMAAMFYSNLGEQKREQGRLAEAIASLQKALVAQPTHVEAQRTLAACLTESQNPAQAAAVLRESLQIKPDDAPTHFNLGIALYAQKLWAEAIPSFQTAIQIDPNNPRYHFYLGQALKSSQQLDLAIAEFHRTVALNPHLHEARFQLGTCYYMKEKYPEAIAAYAELAEATPSYQYVQINMGVIYMMMGEREKAIPHLEAEIRYYPHFVDAYKRLIHAYQEGGDEDGVERVYALARQNGVELNSEP